MLCFVYENDRLVAVQTERPVDRKFIFCADLKSKEQADRLAIEATALTGVRYIGVDLGEREFPRFDVQRASH